MAQGKEGAAILAVHYSALAHEQARYAREAVKEAREHLDRLVRRVCDAMRAGEGVGMAELLVEVSGVIGILDAADAYLIDALGFSVSVKWRAKDALGRDVKAREDCANAPQCGELARTCNPEICPLFVVRKSE
jgi:hypothetical protein